MSPDKRSFPVMLECGTISHFTLQSDDKADIECARIEPGNGEVVIRLRLKCRHPVHGGATADEVEA